MSDDGYVRVPIPFGFPYYGKIFTDSFMFDNGVVGLFSPGINTTPQLGCDPSSSTTLYSCGGNQWSSQQFSTLTGPTFNYMIAPLWTDLYPRQDSTYITQADSTQITYSWNKLGEFFNLDNVNSFDLQLKPSGSIGIRYRELNISQSNVSVGLTGDLSLGQYAQHYWAPAGTQITTNTIPSWSVTETGVNACLADPISHPACPGYAEAYLQQQCTISPLYSPGCPGYAQAYYDQQCSVNPLYHTGCPGYEQAYFDQQCNLDPLYNSQCTGYQQAYFDQQCELNGLYSTACPNYADALYVQQCTADPLYDSGCTGYAQAYALKYVINAPTTVISSDPVSSTTVVSDPVVNQSITTTATSASPADAATATVPLVTAPQPVTATAAVEEKKEESKDKTTAGGPDSKDQPKTTRQALAERRLAAARAKAIEDGKQLAGRMGEAATMEAQIQVQGVVLAAMGFVPGFDNYSKISLQDAIGYQPFEIYKDQRNVDNPAGRRFLTGADARHQEMVDQQYGGLAR